MISVLQAQEFHESLLSSGENPRKISFSQFSKDKVFRGGFSKMP
jgi:hypothetical protein